jgi:hypothetical protein
MEWEGREGREEKQQEREVERNNKIEVKMRAQITQRHKKRGGSPALIQQRASRTLLENIYINKTNDEMIATESIDINGLVE